MKVGAAGLAIIKKWEGYRDTAYQDGGGVWTIGYGHTGRMSPPPVTQGMKVTAASAELMLKQDLAPVEKCLNMVLARPATQNQFDAMASLAFNIGTGGFERSTVLRKFNDGDLEGSAKAFMLWVKDNGKVVQGLVNRRADEAELFRTADSNVPVVATKETKTMDFVLERMKAVVAVIVPVVLGFFWQWADSKFPGIISPDMKIAITGFITGLFVHQVPNKSA